MMSRICLYMSFSFALAISSSDAAEKVPKVLVIGIDGCRPDAMQAAKTPNLDSLIEAGAIFEGTDIRKPEGTDKANTISGPGWSNLLTGVWPDKHRVLDNKFMNPNYEQYPHMFVRLKQVYPDAVTASFSTWKPIEEKIVSAANVSRNFSESPKDYARWDREAAEACADYLKSSKPDLVVCYQGEVDEAGHAHGFHPSVPEYISAIETVDKNVEDLINAIQSRSNIMKEDWLTIVCTDHGGLGTGHGDGHDVPEIRSTFLIVSGASAKKGRFTEPTYQVDVVPTALQHLNVPISPDWKLDGHAVGLANQKPRNDLSATSSSRQSRSKILFSFSDVLSK